MIGFVVEAVVGLLGLLDKVVMEKVTSCVGLLKLESLESAANSISLDRRLTMVEVKGRETNDALVKNGRVEPCEFEAKEMTL